MEKERSAARSLAAETVRKTKDLIREWKLLPGDRLPSEGELADMFGVGRSTVREAMKVLKAEHIIEIKRGNGTFVCDDPGVVEDPLGLSMADQKHLLRDLLEARLLIEPQAAMLAAERAGEKEIEALEEIIREMEKAGEDGDENAALDLKFHSALAGCTGNTVLQRVVPIIHESIVRGQRVTGSVEGSLQRARRSHTLLCRAIRSHDALLAKYLMERHIRETLSDIEGHEQGEVLQW